MIEQLAIYLENRCGRVAECCKVFNDNDINLKYISIADTTDFGILRVITDNNEKAKTVLQNSGFIVTNVSLIGVEVNDTPGELASLLNLFSTNNIDISYLYSFKNKEGKDIIAFKATKEQLALDILKNSNKKII